MSIINRKQSNANDAGTGAKVWIPLDRWSHDSNLSLVLRFTGSATVNIEGTLDQINRGDTAIAFTIDGGTAITADNEFSVTAIPMEAIRLNQTAGAGSVSFHVMGNT
jgi:hypothetical protein